MRWHVVVRCGGEDGFQPDIPPTEGRIWVAFDRATDPSRVGHDVARKVAAVSGLELGAFLSDLTRVAMAVYTADLRIPRRFSADGWTREIAVYLPVQDVDRWVAAESQIVKALQFLTGDTWRLLFRTGVPGGQSGPRRLKIPRADEVCLFSGGLDSLVGAIDRLESGKHVALVGHHGAGITNPVQERVLAPIASGYGARALPFMFWVQPPKLESDDTETTMRSRSLLFLALGLAVANVFGGDVPLVVAENGLISLNVPLTGARSGSLSTRTTHPYFFQLLREALSTLGVGTRIELPYRFKTKGEMLAECANRSLLIETVPLTMSCSHPESGRFRGGTPGHHCGYCVPCIIRRAAVRAAEVPDAPYNTDVLVRPPPPETESGRDFRAFEIAVERLRDANGRRFLLDVLGTGELPPEDVSEYASVYRRGMAEVGAFIGERAAGNVRRRISRVS